ncbi:chaperonin 10-like protein [Xylariales sp. AK1849]|nr:chaperonin 10-like protein [Xylariales sp. AK1849]
MAETINLPQTMKAVFQPDKTSHRLIMTTQPIPVSSHPQDVLIRVHASSPCLGELDWALWAAEFIGSDKVPIPGQDIAGVVLCGPHNDGGGGRRAFKPGNKVYAHIPANRPGGAAQYTLARTSELDLTPRNLTSSDAAATLLSSLTAYQALFVKGDLDSAALKGDGDARVRNAGKRVLITAAAGSVGGWAVQLAKLAGVRDVGVSVGGES